MVVVVGEIMPRVHMSLLFSQNKYVTKERGNKCGKLAGAPSAKDGHGGGN